MNHGVLAFKVLRKSINVSGKLFSWVYFLIKYQFPSKLARRPYFYKLTVILLLDQLPQGQKYHMSCHKIPNLRGLDSGCDATYGNLGKVDLGMSPTDINVMSYSYSKANSKVCSRYIYNVGPPVIRLFINPMNTIVIGTINQSEIGAICTN